MARAHKLLLVISLIANVLLLWAYENAGAETEQVRAETERLQSQLSVLSQDLRGARSENAQLRAQLAPGEAASVAPAPVGQAAPPETLEALHRIQDSVSAIRGLHAKDDVPIVFLDREQLRQYFQASFDREYSPEERAQDQKLLTYIGLIQPTFDLPAFLVDLLQEQVVGFYDDEQKRMALIGEGSALSADERITFAHEYTHTLQDQHFDLDALNPPDSENDDRSLAIQALVEGDAVLAMGLWATQYLSQRELEEASRSGGDDQTLRRAPLVLRQELLFPYTDGARFVRQIYDQGGYAAVDQAFRNPPSSTEQILHPEKYQRGEAPIDVELAGAEQVLGVGWSDITANTLGELDLRILIEQYTDRQTANRAAAGWGGDRYRLAEHSDGRLAFMLRTAWDTPTDAEEFSSALVRGLRKRFGVSDQAGESAAQVAIPSSTQPSIVVRRGGEVLLVMGPDTATVQQAVSAVGF